MFNPKTILKMITEVEIAACVVIAAIIAFTFMVVLAMWKSITIAARNKTDSATPG